MLHLDFKERFNSWWRECQVEGREGHKFMKKLLFVKSKMKEWNKVPFGDVKEKKIILSDIVKIDSS